MDVTFNIYWFIIPLICDSVSPSDSAASSEINGI